MCRTFAAMGRTPAAVSDDLYAKFTFGAGFLFVVLELIYFHHVQSCSLIDPCIDNSGHALGRDFINTWMGGRAAFAGGPAAWFDHITYNDALREITGRANFPVHYWSYPPHLLLLTWPLGLLGYLPAYVLWCAVGLALYLFAARCGGANGKYMLFLAAAPAVGINVFFGQNGFITAALLIGGLANLDRRPILAGVLFGILTFKPQFGLLLPIMLLLTARWRVIATAVATAAVFGIVVTLWFGPDIWLDYVRLVGPQQHGTILAAADEKSSVAASAFVDARLVGLPVDWAWAVQALSSCCAVVMVVWAFWRQRDPVLSNALLVTATFLFSPWMLNYDMVVFAYFLVLLRQRADNTRIDDGFTLAMWTLPFAMMPFNAAGIPLAMLLLPAFAGRLIWRLYRGHSEQAVGGDLSVAPAAA